MTIKGIITLALPEASGTSKSGKAWRRRSYICRYDSTNDKYPKEVLFDVMSDKIDQFNIQQGGQYELEVDFSVREYNGKHYMQATAWKATCQSAPAVQQVATALNAEPTPEKKGDDLPF